MPELPDREPQDPSAPASPLATPQAGEKRAHANGDPSMVRTMADPLYAAVLNALVRVTENGPNDSLMDAADAALDAVREVLLTEHVKVFDGYLFTDICETCSDHDARTWALWPCAVVARFAPSQSARGVQ